MVTSATHRSLESGVGLASLDEKKVMIGAGDMPSVRPRSSVMLKSIRHCLVATRGSIAGLQVGSVPYHSLSTADAADAHPPKPWSKPALRAGGEGFRGRSCTMRATVPRVPSRVEWGSGFRFRARPARAEPSLAGASRVLSGFDPCCRAARAPTTTNASEPSGWLGCLP